MGGRVTQTVAAQVGGGAQVGTQIAIAGRISTLLHGIAFVAGFTLIFVSLGLATTAFFSSVGGAGIRIFTEILARVGGTFILVMGLQMVGLLPMLFRFALARPETMNNLALSLAILVFSALLILWAFVDWLIALPVIVMFGFWLVLGGAFSRPGAFWTQTITTFQQFFYADTRRQMAAHGRQGYAGSMFMGLVFAAGWTPCIGPIYGSILTMAATGQDVGRAGIQLFAYSMGLGIPFLLAALMLDGAQSFLRRLQRHVRKIERLAGTLLILIGIAVASGQMQEVSRGFAQQFADFSYQLEACVLEIAQGERALGEFGLCMNANEIDSRPS
jgi:cytochrome c-type biogenesis protein